MVDEEADREAEDEAAAPVTDTAKSRIRQLAEQAKAADEADYTGMPRVRQRRQP